MQSIYSQLLAVFYSQQRAQRYAEVSQRKKGFAEFLSSSKQTSVKPLRNATPSVVIL